MEAEEYNFRNLVGIMLFSNAGRIEKAREVFRLFDFGGNDSLGMKEVEFMF